MPGPIKPPKKISELAGNKIREINAEKELEKQNLPRFPKKQSRQEEKY